LAGEDRVDSPAGWPKSLRPVPSLRLHVTRGILVVCLSLGA